MKIRDPLYNMPNPIFYSRQHTLTNKREHVSNIVKSVDTTQNAAN